MSAQLRALTIQNGTTQRLASSAVLEVGAGIISSTGAISVDAATTGSAINIGGSAVGVGPSGINIGVGPATCDVTIGNATGTVTFPGAVTFNGVATATTDVWLKGNVKIGDNQPAPDSDTLIINSLLSNNYWASNGYADNSMLFAQAQSHTIGVETNASGAGGSMKLFAGEGTGAKGGDMTIAAGLTNGAFGGGNLTLTGGDSSLGGAGGYTILASGGSGSSTLGTGGDLILVAGGSSVSPFTSQAATGGAATLKAGDSGGAGSSGGALNLAAGTASAGIGGAVTIASGAGGTTGAGGAIGISAGAGGHTGGVGGAITITSGLANAGAAGVATFQAGPGNATFAGGIAYVRGGANLTAGPGGTGGAAEVHGGDSTHGAGGDASLIGGSGGLTGGNVYVTAGAPTNAGGANVVIAATSAGSSFAVNDGGFISGTAGNALGGGAGGAITYTAGNGDGAGNGGNIGLTAGVGGATGQGGIIRLTGGDAGVGGLGTAGPVSIDAGNPNGGTSSGVAIGTNAHTAAVGLGDPGTNAVLVHPGSTPSSGIPLNAGIFEIFNQRTSFAAINTATGAVSPTHSYILAVENTTTNNAGGGLQIQTGNAGPGNNNGGILAMIGGAATGTGAGGAVTLTGGLSGPSSGATPGAVSLTGGQAGALSGSTGGSVNLTGGQGDTTGNGGPVILQGGPAGASGNGGYVNIIGSNGVHGGDVAITSGNGGTPTTGGQVAIQYANTTALLLRSNPGGDVGTYPAVLEVESGAIIRAITGGMIDLPRNFEINGLPTSYTGGAGPVTSTGVTANNLNVLTAGPTSDADALHTHTGISGATTVVLPSVAAGETITAGMVVTYNNNGGVPNVYKCNAKSGGGVITTATGFAAAGVSSPTPVGVQVTGLVDVTAIVDGAGAIVPTDIGKTVWMSKLTSGYITKDVSAYGVGDVVQKVGIVVQGGATVIINIQIGDETVL